MVRSASNRRGSCRLTGTCQREVGTKEVGTAGLGTRELGCLVFGATG